MTNTTDRAPYARNTATMPAEAVHNAKNLGGDKENVGTFTLVSYLPDLGEWHEPIRVTLWMGRSANASVVHASVWVRHGASTPEVSGYGTAGGYGYCKRSGAVDEAIRSAGIVLERDIHGCGEGAIKHAILAIAKATGWARFPHHIVET